MALEKKIIGLPLSKGLNRKIVDRNLPPGELTEVDNAQVVEGGELRKRKGYHNLSNTVPAIVSGSSAGTVATGKAIAAYGDEIVSFDGRYAYSKTSTGDNWVNKGRVVGCTLENEFVEAGTSLVQTSAQIGQANNFEVQVWSEMDPTEAVSFSGTVTLADIPGGYTKADGLVQLRITTEHNLSVGAKLAVNFAGWADGDYVVTEIVDEEHCVIDYTTTIPGSPTTDTATYTGSGVTWRTYAKVIDKVTRSEIVARTLINTFTTANSMYNIPRAQVASAGQYVFILVHVGSGRVKYTKVDTGGGSGALTSALTPSLLVSSVSDVLFSVDLTNPDWCVEAVSNTSITNGLCVFRRTTASSQYLRLSYYSTTSGTLAESSAETPVSINTAPHFPPANSGAAATSFATYPATYPGASAKGNMELVAGLMLKVVKPSGASSGDYVAVAYTISEDKTSVSGSADEPGGIAMRVYDKTLALQGAEQEAVISSANTQFGSTSSPGYVLINGTAGKNESGVVRFFLTMIKNTSNCNARSPKFLVNSYDYTLGGGGGIADKGLNLFGCTVTSDCFDYNGDLYLGVGYASRPNHVSGAGMMALSTFNTSVGLIIDHQGQVMAKGPTSAGPWCQEIDFRFLQYGTANRLHFMYGVPRVIAESATTFRFGSSRYSGVNTQSDGTDLTAMDAAVGFIDFAPARYLPSVQANGALKVASGILWDYSGDYFKEENFFWYPEIHSSDVTGSGVLSGAFSYKAVYEWVDHNGKVQQSNPSQSFTTGTLSSKAPLLRIYGLHLTYKKDATGLLDPSGNASVVWGARSEVKVVLYRTQASQSIFFRCAEVLMDRLDRIQEITDNLSDADLVDNQILYTMGGNAGHICPPSQYDIAVWKDRLWLATTDNTIWHSKRFKQDREAGFNDLFVRSVDNQSEKINSICPNLEHLLVFGSKSGYYISGDGPSDSGAGPDFSPMRVFAPGQSVVPGSCRVETPAGVFFQARQGLMLVGRNMQVSYKGAYAEGEFDVTNFLIDGHVIEDSHEVRFTASGSGKILVYNYVFDLWSLWTLNASLGNNAGSVVVGGAHYRLGTNGITYKQQAGADYNDQHGGANASYAFGFTTGWINVGQLQQLGRVYRLLFLGDYNAASNPKVLYHTDYDESATTVEMDAAPGTSKFQLIFKLPKQKIKALKFRLTETTPSAGAYMAVQGVSLLAGLKKPGTSFKFPTSDHIT